jgi:hypothetical protein
VKELRNAWAFTDAHVVGVGTMPVYEENTNELMKDDASNGVCGGYSVHAGPTCKTYEEAAKGLPRQKGLDRHVSFDLESTVVYEVTPYSEVYGLHPKLFDFDRSDVQVAWCFMAPPDTTTDSDSEQEASDSDEDEEEQPVISRSGRHPYGKLKETLDVFEHKLTEVDDDVSTQDTVDSVEGSLISWSDDEDDDDEDDEEESRLSQDESVELVPDSVQSLHEALSVAFVSPPGPEVVAKVLHISACIRGSQDVPEAFELSAESAEAISDDITPTHLTEPRKFGSPCHRRTRSIRLNGLQCCGDV